MDINGLLVQAGHLMLTGMLVVFVFLGLLVFVTKLLALVAGDDESNSDLVAATAPVPVPAADGAISPQIVAAISAAIHQYRQSK